MKHKNDKGLPATRDTGLRTAVTSPGQFIQPNDDGHVHMHLRQNETCEQPAHTNEVRIKSEPILRDLSEELRDVLDELGEILDEELGKSGFEMKPDITPPPPSISMTDDTSLFTRRCYPEPDPPPINFAHSLEASCKAAAKNSKKDQFTKNESIKKSMSYDSKSHMSSPDHASHKRKLRYRRSSSKKTSRTKASRAVESNTNSPRPTTKERRRAHRRSRHRSSTSAERGPRSKKSRSGSFRRRYSRSRSKRRKRPVRTRSWRRSSPRERLDRRPKSIYRSRSPDNMGRSNFIRYSHTLQRSRTERIQRHRRSSSTSPRRPHDLSRMRFGRCTPLRLSRQRSRSRSNLGKFSRIRRSRSRSSPLNFPNRDRSWSLSKSTKILEGKGSRSRSVSLSEPLREPSISIISSTNVRNDTRSGSRPTKLRIRRTSREKSPSAQRQPLLDKRMTAPVPVGASYQPSQSEEQWLQQMAIAPLHYNRVTRPVSLQNHLRSPPPPPHTFYMHDHFTNIQYRSYQASELPLNPTEANLDSFDLRHRLDTSRSFYYLDPNDLRHRIQDLYVQNTYSPLPAFNVHAQWPPGYKIDYNSNGYY